MTKVTEIFRHPIKSHGREALDRVELSAGNSMPYDRLWAVALEAAKADGSAWAVCGNFIRGSKSPKLLAIHSRLDEKTETVTLSHPERPDLSFHPDTEAEKLFEWIMPLIQQSKGMPREILRLDGRGWTDSHFASVTLCNVSSHQAVEDHVGRPISNHRWRGNIWFDGYDAWAELDWIGKEIQVGDAVLRPLEPTDRCNVTHVNTQTGVEDINMLAALAHFGHQDFSVRAEVLRGGAVSLNDSVKVL